MKRDCGAEPCVVPLEWHPSSKRVVAPSSKTKRMQDCGYGWRAGQGLPRRDFTLKCQADFEAN